MKKYVIGLDFGTLSGRCILVDTENGKEIAESLFEYPHGVMDESLPNGKKLPPLFALQHPNDYLEVLRVTVPDVIKKSGVSPETIVGIGIDFTACTILPIDEKGTPLCYKKKFENEPHAYVKLWKHHSAQPQADKINELAKERNESWLPVYGGNLSSEWALPKILETLENAPDVYREAYRFIEAADWLSYVLTGEETHSAIFAGYKATWNAETGYPDSDFFEALNPEMKNIVGTKLSEKVCGIGSIAGKLSIKWADIMGLLEGTPIALPLIDAHAAMSAAGITEAGEMMIIAGTSACHIINADVGKNVKGICGYVKDGLIPGYYTYEAGQAGVGDIFDWYVKQNVPAEYTDEAKKLGISIHKLLRQKAFSLKPGQSGLLALDWLNGNRSVFVDSELSGLILGMTLKTKPEEIYRAWIESTAFGTRMIIETFIKSGIPVNDIFVSGGIAQKDAMMMQIFADVTGKRIRVAGSTQAGALGSAIYASVAAGVYPSIKTASLAMAPADKSVFEPIPENVFLYERLYDEYRTLSNYFGNGENDVMKRLLKRKTGENEIK